MSNVLRSYSLSCLESMPAANMSPSGSMLTTGRPFKCINPWQFGERRSHKRIVRSRDPDMNVSLMGDICKATTLWRNKNGREGLNGYLTIRMTYLAYSNIMIWAENVILAGKQCVRSFQTLINYILVLVQ